MSGECRDIEELLSPYADGELDAEAARKVEAHLASCASCRAMLEAWRDSEAALASLAPARSDVEWERLARRVDERIDAVEAEAAAGMAAPAGVRAHASAPAPEPPRKLRRWIWGGSGALAAAALVTLFWPWLSGTRHGTALQEKTASSSADESPAFSEPAETGGVPSAPGADVRRVAIAQEQEMKDALGSSLQGGGAANEAMSAEGRAAPAPSQDERTRALGYLSDAPATPGMSRRETAAPPPAPKAVDPSATAVNRPAHESSKAVESALPSTDAARSLEDLRDRFEQFTGEKLHRTSAPPAATTPSQAPAPTARFDLGKLLRSRPSSTPAAETQGAAPSSQPSMPRQALAWGNARLAEGDTNRARIIYVMLSGAFEGNDARADAWYARVELDAKDALSRGDAVAAKAAAVEAGSCLTRFPDHPRHAETLAQRVRLWAAVAAKNPADGCAPLAAARAEWQRAAGPGTAFPAPAPAATSCP